MERLYTSTRGAGSWRERLANPERQWKRQYSALETAVSWEEATNKKAGMLPQPISKLFEAVYGPAELLLAVAEHKVPLAGSGGDSQSDVWALIHTAEGVVSTSVEAKASEPFGSGNQTLSEWLSAANTDSSRSNREKRWGHIEENLPDAEGDSYSGVAYQLLHRCAAAVIEAKRFRLENAAFLVQAFETPNESFEVYSRFCDAMGIQAGRGEMHTATVGSIQLGIGWADCPLATDGQVASVI